MSFKNISSTFSCQVIIISTCILPFTCPWPCIFGESFIHASTHLILASIRWDTPLTYWGQTTWPTFCRQYLHTSISSNGIFKSNFTSFYFVPNWKYVKISSSVGLEPIKWQAIICTTTDFYAMSPGHNECHDELTFEWMTRDAIAITFNVRGNMMHTSTGPKQR